MFHFYKISGSSMLPTLREGDFAVSENLSYKFRSPKINDIVIAKSPEDGRVLVKRVVAKSGNQYRIEGDNVLCSTDSRRFGFINREDIVGRVILR